MLGGALHDQERHCREAGACGVHEALPAQQMDDLLHVLPRERADRQLGGSPGILPLLRAAAASRTSLPRARGAFGLPLCRVRRLHDSVLSGSAAAAA